MMDSDTYIRVIEGIAALPPQQIITLELFTDANKYFYKRGTELAGKHINKWQRCKFQLGANYENSVNLQRWRENKSENFKALEHRWGEHISNKFMMNRDGTKIYLIGHKLDELEVVYYTDGNLAPMESMVPYLKVESNSSRQEVEDLVVYRNPTVDNILSITWGGHRHAFQELRDLLRP
jgi:hypothetical protein